MHESGSQSIILSIRLVAGCKKEDCSGADGEQEGGRSQACSGMHLVQGVEKSAGLWAATRLIPTGCRDLGRLCLTWQSHVQGVEVRDVSA